MKKRILSGLLAITVMASMITGCGSKTEAPATAPEAAYDASDAATEEWYEPATEAEADYDDSQSLAPSVNAEAGATYKSEAARDFDTTVENDHAWYDDDDLPDVSGEDYSFNPENGFDSVLASPLSTFAADVDTASYSNMRRFVNDGFGLYDFPEGSIRAEELINYFKYDYAEPEKGQRFGVDAQVSDCPWNRKNKLMILGVNTKELKETKRPDSNIVFLLDVSGSMNSENKLPLLKDAMGMLTENLGKNDRVSIVTYASGTKVVLEGVRGDDNRKIMRAFDSLKAGGATNGEGGIELAYEIAEENFIKGGNNRIILGTDGDFNVGKCTGDDLKDLISEKKESGIFLSVLGFGMGNYSDTTAETLADAGNGNYSYIDSMKEAEKVLNEEFYSTIYTVAKDTKLQVEFNPAMVSQYRLIGYENRKLNAEDFRDDKKDGGELGAGHQVTAVYEIRLAEDDEEYSNLKYQNSVISDKGKKGDEWCTLSIAYKDPDKDSSEYLEFPISANNYTNRPSDSFILATSVAEYSMALTDSDYLKDMSREEALGQAIKNVNKIDHSDEYVDEFLSLMEQVERNTDGYRYEDNDDKMWYE